MKRSQIQRHHLVGAEVYKRKHHGSAGGGPGRCSLCRQDFKEGQNINAWYEGRRMIKVHHDRCPRKKRTRRGER